MYRIIKMVFPSIIMMVVTSIYTIVDGFFVANFVGKTAFTALTFIMPFIMILGSIGFVFGTGGSSIVSKLLGEGKKDVANKVFSFIVMITFISGVILSIVGIVNIKNVALLLGARGDMLRNSVVYGRILIFGNSLYMLQYLFQCFFSAAGKRGLGLSVTIVAGIINFLLDFLLIIVFHLGLSGAAIATVFGQILGGIFPLIYFSRNNSSMLRLVNPLFDLRILLNTVSNGFSEFLTNASSSIVGIIFNVQLIKYSGENGVAVYGILMYVSYIFQSVYLGLTIGVSPLISYYFGAKDENKLNEITKSTLKIICVFGVIMFLIAQVFSNFFANVFVGNDKELVKITVHAFNIYSFGFLLEGFSIFVSALFTALNDGFTSALVSFLRTMVFQSISVITMPLLLGANGVWGAMPIAEMISLITAMIFFKKKILFYKRRKSLIHSVQ